MVAPKKSEVRSQKSEVSFYEVTFTPICSPTHPVIMSAAKDLAGGPSSLTPTPIGLIRVVMVPAT
jgi:hypothetical protein